MDEWCDVCLHNEPKTNAIITPGPQLDRAECSMQRSSRTYILKTKKNKKWMNSYQKNV